MRHARDHFRSAGIWRAALCAALIAAGGECLAQTKAGDPKEPQTPTYYFISDMHIGGDAGLNPCAFEGELIGFLRRIAEEPGPTELIIAGDAFGMWELTGMPCEAKIPHIAATHQNLFQQFRETGRRVTITLLPGNHDYELACIPVCKDQLAEYNIHLVAATHLTRDVAGRRIWVEHGNQEDEFNKFPDFGNRYGLPAGYFVTRSTVVAAALSAERVQSSWLNDLESVYPNEELPFWICSNYFYREMDVALRWFLLPFLLLFTVSAIVLAGRALETAGILPTKIFHTELKSRFGLTGRLVDWVLWVNGVVISTLLVLAIPVWLLTVDVHAALRRYGVDPKEDLKIQKESHYIAAAKRVFEKDPKVAVFIYGHTHAVSLRKVGSRYVINTGTWLKRLERVRAHARLLPDVYVPTYRLNYFVISGKGNDLRIGYHMVPKKPASELTLLQRVMILGRYPHDKVPVPKETLVGKEGG